MKHEVNRPCMVCAGRNSRLLHSLDFAEQGYPGLFQVRECEGCGLLFNSPRLDDAAIADLYGAGYYVFHERERDALPRVRELLARTVGVARQYTDAREVLEVGSAKGYLLALLRAQGYAVRGVELSASAAAFARERFGLDVFTGTVEDWVASPGFKPAEMVVSTDVVEHVTDPPAFIAALHRAVAPGGWLVLGTPNADSDHRRALGPAWLGFNPFHIVLFSRRTLGTLLQRAGFKLVLAYTYTNGEPPAPAPARGALRPALRALLRHSGLLPVARRARERVLALVDAPLDASAWADPEAAAPPDYLASDDARSPRREACRGDNLVLLARREG